MMLATTLNPNSGTATVCAYDIITERDKVREFRLLLLDEPTFGLDVQTRRNLWEYIRVVNIEKGTSAILATHYMEWA